MIPAPKEQKHHKLSKGGDVLHSVNGLYPATPLSRIQSTLGPRGQNLNL